MQRRQVVLSEQPHVLHGGLQQARIVTIDRTTPIQHGVPHGVTRAIVFANRVFVLTRPDGIREIRFCESKCYRVLAETIDRADDAPYPSYDQTEISASCPLPTNDGFYPVRMRVSVNGSVHAHIESFTSRKRSRRAMECATAQ